MLGEEGAPSEPGIKVRHEQNGGKAEAGKEILPFISSISSQITTPAFGNNIVRLRVIKEAVNIKVQRIFLPFGGTDVLKVHAPSTPTSSHEDFTHLPFHSIHTSKFVFVFVA